MLSVMKLTFNLVKFAAYVGKNKCILERKSERSRGGPYTLTSNTTFVSGEFNTLAEVVDALDNDSSFK